MKNFILKVSFMLGIGCMILVSCEKTDNSISIPNGNGNYDCVSIQKNILDTCNSWDTTMSMINGNCRCHRLRISDTTFSCPQLLLNIGDSCRTPVDGFRGTVDSNCICVKS